VRGKLSDQDLTDYALNELGPEERLYVESMLAVSEECRNDIYEMIDMAMLVEEGFEREEQYLPVALTLTPDQRMALLNVRMPNRFLYRTAAALAAAAAVTLTWANKEAWLPTSSVTAATELARVSSQMTNYVVDAVSNVSNSEGEDFVTQLASFRTLADEPVILKWLPTQAPGGASVLGSAPAFNLEAAPHTPFDLMP
jgi:anti-sigma factor RsiW